MSSVHTTNVVAEVAAATIKRFADVGLQPDELAITLSLIDDQPGLIDHYRGDERIYPASIVKLFYLVAAHQWLEDGRISDTEELRRALKDMIVDSGGDATHYVIDLLTGTTSGIELPEEEMSEWVRKRNVVNQYFAGRGYRNLNINQKPWADGPYGRERVFVGMNRENRNMLTTNATTKLLTEIVNGNAVSPAASKQMLALLERDYTAKVADPDNQATGFSGQALPAGSQLWSKAGWTSIVRHDAAVIQLPGAKKFVLVTFTINHANQYELIPFVAEEVIRRLEH